MFAVCLDSVICRKVSEQRVGDGELIFFKGTKTQASCTIVLRGANDFMLDEMDRYMMLELRIEQQCRAEHTTVCTKSTCGPIVYTHTPAFVDGGRGELRKEAPKPNKVTSKLFCLEM